MPEPRSSLFISYGRGDDEPFVWRLHEWLSHPDRGFSVWFDRRSMPSRSLSFLQEIRDAVAGHERLLVIIGPSAVSSDYVRAEWQYALAIEHIVVPVLRLGEFPSIPPELKNLHCIDARERINESEAFSEIERQLRWPVPELCPLSPDVRELPPHFRPRPDDLSALSSALLPDLRQPVVVQRERRITVAHGMGGAGKTVLASAFARSTEVRRAFRSGVVWLSPGSGGDREASPPSKTDEAAVLTRAREALGDDSSSPIPTSAARKRLGELLSSPRSYLVVLDDVQRLSEVEPWYNLMGAECRLLVTTREASLATSLGGVAQLALGGLDEDGALSLLEDWSGVPRDEMGDRPRWIAAHCAGLPLALATSGAMVRDGTSWEDLADALESADVGYLSRELPNYPYPGVLQALTVSLDRLGARERDFLIRFRAFRPTAAVPEAIAIRVATCDGTLDERTARGLITTLVGRSLLKRETTGEGSRIVIHDLIRDLLRARRPVGPDDHRSLIAAYHAGLTAGWASGPNDGYYFQNLVYHLIGADRIDEALRLVTSSPDWWRTKVAWFGGNLSLVDDLRLLRQENLSVEAIAKTCAVLHCVRDATAHWTARDLGTLAGLGHGKRAMAAARLQSTPTERIRGAVEIHAQAAEPAVRRDALALAESILAEVPTGPAALAARAMVASALVSVGGQHAIRGKRMLTDAGQRLVSLFAESERQDGADEAAVAWFEAMGAALSVEEAIATLDRAIVDPTHRAYFLRFLGAAVARAGNSQEALEIARRIERGGADPAVIVLGLSQIVTALTPTRDDPGEDLIESACRCFDQLEECKQPGVLGGLARALAARKDPRLAKILAAMGRLASVEPVRGFLQELDRRAAWQTYVSALAAAGETSEAQSAARRALSGIKLGESLVDVVAGLVEHGRIDEADSIARTISDVCTRANALSLIARAVAPTSPDRAKSLLRDAESFRAADAVRTKSLAALTAVGTALSSVEERAADHVFRMALARADELPSEYDFSSNLAELVLALSEARRFDMARRVIPLVRNKIHLAESRASLARALARVGRHDEALELAEENRELRMELLTEAGRTADAVAEARLKPGLAAVQAFLAAGATDEALETARAIPAGYEQFQSWMAIARRGSGSALAETALSQAEGAIAAISESEDWTVLQREPASQELADFLADEGRIKDAEKWIVEIHDGRHRILAIGHLGRLLSRKGDPLGAQMLRSAVQHVDLAQPHQRPGLLLNLAEFLWDAGLANEALDAMVDAERRADDDAYVAEDSALMVARWGYLGPALKTLDEQPIDAFVRLTARCVSIEDATLDFDRVTLIASVLAIIGWVRPDWAGVAGSLAQL